MIWVSQYVNNCHECHKRLREGVRRKMTFNDDDEVDGYKGLMIICEPIMYLIWNVNMWVVKNLNSPFQSYCLILGWLKESEVISLDGGSQEIGLFFLNLSVGFQKSTIAIMNCAFRADLCYQVFLLYAFTIHIFRDSVKNVLTIM